MMKQKIRAVSLLCALLMGLTAAGCGRQETPPASSGVSGVSQSTAPGETAGTDTITDPSATQGTESPSGSTTAGSQQGGKKTTAGKTTGKAASQTTSKQGGWSGGDATGKKLFDKRSGVKGEVKLFIPWDTSGDEDFKAIKAGFEKEYPGTTVKVINGEWGTRDIKLTQFIRNGDSPDYVPTGVFDFPRRAIKGLLTPLDDMIQVTDTLDTYVMDNVTTWQGKKYAIIGKRSPGVLYYNTTMLKNAAVAKAPAQLAQENKWTWKDLKDMARRLTVDKNKDGKPDVYGFGTELEFIFPWAQGTNIVKFKNGNPSLNIDDETWRSSLLYYYDGINKDKVFSPVRWGMWEEFANGNVAMYYGPAGEAEKLLNKGMKNWDIAPFPKANSGDASYIGYSSSDGFGVPAGAKNAIGGIAFGEYQYNYYTKKSEAGTSKKIFTEAQQKIMDSLENRITWLYGYGMEDSFCQSFGNYMRKNGDFSALMEEMRPIWQKNLDDTLKGR